MLYHQETKNVLVSHSPKKLGFFWSPKSSSLNGDCSPGALLRSDTDRCETTAPTQGVSSALPSGPVTDQIPGRRPCGTAPPRRMFSGGGRRRNGLAKGVRECGTDQVRRYVARAVAAALRQGGDLRRASSRRDIAVDQHHHSGVQPRVVEERRVEAGNLAGVPDPVAHAHKTKAVAGFRFTRLRQGRVEPLGLPLGRQQAPVATGADGGWNAERHGGAATRRLRRACVPSAVTMVAGRRSPATRSGVQAVYRPSGSTTSAQS